MRLTSGILYRYTGYSYLNRGRIDAKYRGSSEAYCSIQEYASEVVGPGIINFWDWNKLAWIWDLWVDKSERGKGYGTALLKGMLKAAKKAGARVMMDFDTPNPHASSLVRLLVNNGFRVCGTNDRWFADQKDATAVFYGYDL